MASALPPGLKSTDAELGACWVEGGACVHQEPRGQCPSVHPAPPTPEAHASRLSQGRAVLPGATPRSARAIRHLPRPPPLLQSQASLDRSSSRRQSLPSRLNGQSLVLRRRALQWARDSVKARTGAKQARILPLTRVHTRTTRACVCADYTHTAVHTHIEGHACLTGGHACTLTRGTCMHTQRDTHAHSHRGTCMLTHTGGRVCTLTRRDGHAHSHGNTHAHRDTHAHSGGRACTFTRGDTHAHSQRDMHAHSHGNTRAHTEGHMLTRTLTHAHI